MELEPTVIAERVLWRRLGATRQYVGALAADGSLRLSGRDPETGIEVSLQIPFEEIEALRVSHDPPESVSGEPCLVLELAESEAICLRDLNSTESRLLRLAERLEARIIPPRPAGRKQPASQPRRRRKR